MVSRIKEANLGILRYLREHEEMTDNFELVGRAISSYFNRLGAVKQLSCLDRTFFYDEMKKAHKDILVAADKLRERKDTDTSGN
jgi:hypothetical protein